MVPILAGFAARREVTVAGQMVVRAARDAVTFPVVGRWRPVAGGVPGGYRVWGKKARRWWGELHQLRPDQRLDELNGKANSEKVTALCGSAGRGKR
jgi:hypothetical protein